MSIQQSFSHFVVDIIYSRSEKHAAAVIRRLCEITRESSHVFTKEDWVNRDWLAEECSDVRMQRQIIGLTTVCRI